jgi:hypothetical protein
LGTFADCENPIASAFAFCETEEDASDIPQAAEAVFWEEHPDAETALRHSIKAVESAGWKNLGDVRQLFSSADQVGKFRLGGLLFAVVSSPSFSLYFSRYDKVVGHLATIAVLHRKIPGHGPTDRASEIRWRQLTSARQEMTPGTSSAGGLLQSRVLGFGLLEYWDIEVRVFPECKEILIGLARPCSIAD